MVEIDFVFWYMILKYVIQCVICVDKHIHQSHYRTEIHIEYGLYSNYLCAEQKWIPLCVPKASFNLHFFLDFVYFTTGYVNRQKNNLHNNITTASMA